MMEILVQYVTPDILTKVAKEMEKKIYTSLASQGYVEAPQIEATSTVEINFG